MFDFGILDINWIDAAQLIGPCLILREKFISIIF